MKNAALLVAGLMMVGLVATLVVAADDEGEKPVVRKDTGESKETAVRKDADRKEGERKEGDKKPALRGEYGKMAEVCGLTDDQQKQISDLAATRDKEVREIYAKYQTQIMAVLTPEQKAKWNEATVMGMVQGMVKKANLTDEQVAKVKTFVAEQTKDVALADEKARGDVTRKVWEYITREVLTDEQKAALREGERKEGVRKEGDRKEGVRLEGERKDPEKKPVVGD